MLLVTQAAISAVSSYSWSQTCGTGSNMVLVVGDDHRAGPDCTVTGVTYNGVGMTYIRSDVYQYYTVYFRSTIYFMYAPTTGGAETITVTYSGTIGYYGVGGAVSYTGVKQSGQPDNNNGSNEDSGNATVSLTTIANNCRVFATSEVFSESVASTNTSRWSLNIPATSYFWGSGSDKCTNNSSGCGNDVVDRTTIAWAISAVSFAPYVAPSAPSSIILISILSFILAMGVVFLALRFTCRGNWLTVLLALVAGLVMFVLAQALFQLFL